MTSLLGSDPFSGLLSQLGVGGADDFSPDNWLASVDQPDTPALPLEGGRVRNEPHTVAAPPGAAASGGSIALAIDSAMDWIGSMYDWGGNGQNGRGVDCSGLIYAAFKAAGFNVERYRAVDYGHMGTPVDPDDARPGDIVYFDNPHSDTDHVGIYLGGGRFIESPQPGEQVQISQLRGGAQIRRIFPESAYSNLSSDAAGQYIYNAPNGTRYQAEGKSASGDPVAELMALNPTTDPDSLLQGLGAMGQLKDMMAGTAVVQGQKSAISKAPTPGAGGRGGITVGQVSGLTPAEAYLIQHESGGDPTADNPTSTAYGIWQGLAATRRDYARRFGFSPDTTDVGEQLVMFRAYVKDRYGTAEDAAEFWRENHWY